MTGRVLEIVMAAGADAASPGRARAPASVHTPGTAPPKLSVQETGVCLAAEAKTAILPPPKKKHHYAFKQH